MSYSPLDAEALSAIALSLKVSLTSTLLVLLTGVPLAYLLSWRRSLKLLELLLMLPVVLSPTVVGYILLMILGRRGPVGELIYRITGGTILFTWYAAVAAAYVVSLPLFVKAAQSAFSSVKREYIEISYTLGRGRLYTFFRVVLPLSRRGIVAGCTLSFARALGEFGATLMVAGNIPHKTATIPIEIYSSVSSGNFHRANLLVLITVAVSLTLLGIVNIWGQGDTGRY